MATPTTTDLEKLRADLPNPADDSGGVVRTILVGNLAKKYQCPMAEVETGLKGLADAEPPDAAERLARLRKARDDASRRAGTRLRCHR